MEILSLKSFIFSDTMTKLSYVKVGTCVWARDSQRVGCGASKEPVILLSTTLFLHSIIWELQGEEEEEEACRAACYECTRGKEDKRPEAQ